MPSSATLVDSAVHWPPRVVLARICFVTRSRAWMATSFIVPLMMLLGACGTGVFTLQFTVSLNDPVGLAGAPPTRVSVFDPLMGDTSDWAGKSMGTTAPGAPYVGSFQTTDTKMVFDSSPPNEVEAGLYLPSYNAKGYFRFRFSPIAGQQQQVKPGFAPWSDNYPQGKSVVAPILRILSTPTDKGWSFEVVVEMPESAAAPNPTGAASASPTG